MFALIQDLNSTGFRGGLDEKRIRAALDQQIIDMLSDGREKTGIPGVTLLRLVLERFVNQKGGVQT